MADTALIALIPAEVGDAAQATITAGVLTTLTNAYADKAGVPRLQYLYVKKHALSLVLGPEWQSVSAEAVGDFKEALSDRLRGLLAMRAAVAAEIATTEASAGANRPPVLTPMTQTAPVTQADGLAQQQTRPGVPYDANDPSLTGSPYRPTPIVR